jgi:hypothetical protein
VVRFPWTAESNFAFFREEVQFAGLGERERRDSARFPAAYFAFLQKDAVAILAGNVCALGLRGVQSHLGHNATSPERAGRASLED